MSVDAVITEYLLHSKMVNPPRIPSLRSAQLLLPAIRRIRLTGKFVKCYRRAADGKLLLRIKTNRRNEWNTVSGSDEKPSEIRTSEANEFTYIKYFIIFVLLPMQRAISFEIVQRNDTRQVNAIHAIHKFDLRVCAIYEFSNCNNADSSIN